MKNAPPTAPWAGVVAGLLATVPQTVAMEAARRGLPGGSRGRFPPRQVTEAVVRRLLVRRRPPRWSEPTWWAVTAVSHLGFGAVAGAVYPLVSPVAGNAHVRGACFGLAVWASTYLVLFPALGIDAPQGDRPTRKTAELVVAHLAWGTMTAVLYGRLHRRSRPIGESSDAPSGSAG